MSALVPIGGLKSETDVPVDAIGVAVAHMWVELYACPDCCAVLARLGMEPPAHDCQVAP